MTRRGAAGPVRPNEVEAVANTSGGVGPGQRLDKWLWYTRIVKSRSLAAALIEAGRVRLNRTKVDKPKQTVRPGDVITATVNRKVRVLKVVLPGVRRGPAAEAQTLYEDLTPVEVPTTSQTRQDQPLQPLAVAQREPGSRRPTKRERRQTDQLRGRD